MTLPQLDTYLSEDEFNRYMEYYSNVEYLSVDTEGTLNHPFSKTWGVSTSYGGVAEYFAFKHMLGNNLPGTWFEKLKRVIEGTNCLVVHHAKHDLRALQSMEINYTGKFYDTMLMAHMVNENWYSKELDALAKIFKTGRKRTSELMDAIIKGFGWEYVPVEVIKEYGANDAFITEQIYQKLLPDFQTQGFDGELWGYEQKFARLLAKMENDGIKIDLSVCEEEYDKGLKILESIRKRLSFNPGSPQQLGKYLLEELKLPPVGEKTKSGNYSFNKENMEVYDELLAMSGNEDAKLILTYRGWQKVCSTNYKAYLEKVYPDGRIRCNYKQHGTHTGRLSCDNPNLQNIPKLSEKPWNGKLRRAFIAEEGYTRWTIDYSQLEFRLAAAYSKDQHLLDAFNDDSRDVFDEMAARLGMDRDPVKGLNYTVQYGGQAKRVSRVFNVSLKAADAIIKNYYRDNPGIKKITDIAADRCLRQGFIKYWTGRRRHFVNRKEGARLAFNSLLQGGGFEIVKRGMIKGDEAGLNNEECRLNLQIHDEIGLEIKNGKEDEYLPAWQEALEKIDYDFGVHFKTEVKKWGTKDKWTKKSKSVFV